MAEFGSGGMQRRVEPADEGKALEWLRRPGRRSTGRHCLPIRIGRGEMEGVGHVNSDRPDPVDPTGSGEYPVPGGVGLARRQPSGDEPGRSQPGDLVLEADVPKRSPRRPPIERVTATTSPSWVRVGVSLRAIDHWSAGDGSPPKPGGSPDQKHRGGQQFGFTKAPPKHEERQTGAQRRPPRSVGIRSRCVVPGTRSRPSTPSTTALTVVPRISASGRTPCGAASTGWTMDFTSSGVT